jgi:8-oxo-dGTP pyrophosphatase MutT (NUDIX family)
MPKGKREPGETSIQCAIREFKEETGIDVSLDNSQVPISLVKTNFYLKHTQDPIIKKYKTNEIVAVKWVYVDEVIKNQEMYSKQVILTAHYLVKKMIYPR